MNKKNPAHLQEIGKTSQAESLEAVISNMDYFSHHALGRIGAIARLSLAALESPDGHGMLDALARSLETIRDMAAEYDDRINAEAESVGCNYVDDGWSRRRDAARRSANNGMLAQDSLKELAA